MRWLAILATALGAAGAQAAPLVDLKAHTHLTLTRVRLLDGGRIEVVGQLTDKLTGDGIPGQRITVMVGGERERPVTGSDGSFQVTVTGEPGPQQVALDYSGAGVFERAEALTVTTDPAKSQVELTIAKLADDPGGTRLRIAATGDEGPVQLPVELAVATPGKDDWKPLRTVQTGEIVVTRREAGGPGLHRLRAAFAGDDLHQKQSTEVTFELTSGTTTTMSVRSAKLAYEDDLVVAGKVTDDDGRPVERAAVTLTAGERRLAQTVTAADGTYSFNVEAAIVAALPATGSGGTLEPTIERQLGIQVQADPSGTFVRPSRSPPEVIRIAAPQPVPVSWTVAAFVATVIAAGGFFAARTKPWRWLRRPTPPAEAPSHEAPIEQMPGGLVVARPSIVSTLRRPSDDGFSGVVRDTVRGRPVAEAVVRLIYGDLERELRTAADGSFVIERLEPGEWRAEVAAPGHVTERFAVTIPHRGELRGVRVDLVPVRERVFQLYRRAAEPILPESRLWGIWSPRQIVDHVRSKRPSPALAELTDFVEEIYFSPRLAAETVLGHASERVDRAIHERARPPAR